LQTLLYSNRYDILLVTETWLHNDVCNGVLDPHSAYKIVRKDRHGAHNGGGVAAFVKRNIHVLEVTVDAEFDELELLCFDMVCHAHKLRFFNVYRPPHTESVARRYVDLLVQCLSRHAAKNYSNVIVGDFNCPKIDWKTLTCTTTDYVTTTFFNWVVRNGYTQFVNFATRGANTLDLVLTDCESVVSSISCSTPIGHSDHCVIDFVIFVHTTTMVSDVVNSNKKSYHWYKADFCAMEQHLSNVDWYALIYTNPSALASWSAFIDVLWHVVELYVPSGKQVVNKDRPKRYPHKIVKLTRKKRALWKKCALSPCDVRMQWKYRDCVNKYRACCRNFARQQEENIINADNLGAFYRHVNRRIRHCGSIGPLIDSSNNAVTSDTAIADMFNKHFASVGVIDNGILPSDTALNCTDVLDSVFFADLDVLSAISKLKPNLSAGPDNLPPLLFKKLQYCLAYPIAALFNQLFSVGVVPPEWKNATITPVFKKGVASDVANYRPISLTCVASKIMERVIATKIYSHLLCNDLLSCTQHGFVKGRSTTTNLLEAMNDWTLAVQDKRAVIVAYIDFSRAFDSVSHDKLFFRLYEYGIRGQLLGWLKNFFSHRTHQTRVGVALSSVACLLSGVVQGSGIGPVMFIVFVDQLAKLLEKHHITAKLFADDLKVYLKIENVDDAARLQVALDLITEWSNTWQLSVSVAKCSLLNVGYASVTVDYYLAGSMLPTAEYCRDLGVTMTCNLSMSQHIAEITAKAHQRANCILRSFTSGDENLLLRAFVVYVRPIVEYNSIIWSPYSKQDVDLIEKVQRRFTKRLRNLKHLPYDERLAKLGLPTLELRRLHLDLIFCYKIVFGYVSVNLDDFFTLSTVRSTRGHKYKLYKSRCSSRVRQTFFVERVINVWNSLPPSVNFKSLATFRRTVSCVDFTNFLQYS